MVTSCHAVRPPSPDPPCDAATSGRPRRLDDAAAVDDRGRTAVALGGPCDGATVGVVAVIPRSLGALDVPPLVGPAGTVLQGHGCRLGD